MRRDGESELEAVERLSSIQPLTTVQRIGERLAAADDVEDVVAAVVSGTTEYLGASAVSVGMVDDSGSKMLPLAAVGLSATSKDLVVEAVALEPGVPAHTVLTTREPLFWSSTAERDRDYPRFSDFPTQQAAWAILPLLARGRGVGVLALGWTTARDFVAEDAALLSVIAHQCAVALDRASVLESEREDRDTLDLLAEGTRLMVSALDPDEIVLRLVRLAVPRLAPWCAVYAVDGDRLRRVALEVERSDPITDHLPDFSTVPVDSDLPLAVSYRTGVIQIVPEVSPETVERIQSADLAAEMQATSVTGHWSSLVVPVKAAGSVIGVMSLVSDAWPGAPGPRVLQAAEGLAGRAGIALANAGRFQHEHHTAVMLTRALLPSNAGEVVGFETAARYLPAGGPVAGDWFDLVPIGATRYLVGVGDSAGHGIEAASLMAELRSAARALAVTGSGPAEILLGLGQLLATTSPEGLATALYAVVDSDDEVSTWASAGHVPPLVFDEDGARYLPTNGAAPLGYPPGPRPADDKVRLPVGSGLVLFTDGVVERRHREIDDRLELLRELVGSNRSEPVETLADLIIENLCDVPEDDCCLIVIRRVEAPSSPAQGR